MLFDATQCRTAVLVPPQPIPPAAELPGLPLFSFQCPCIRLLLQEPLDHHSKAYPVKLGERTLSTMLLLLQLT